VINNNYNNDNKDYTYNYIIGTTTFPRKKGFDPEISKRDHNELIVYFFQQENLRTLT